MRGWANLQHRSGPFQNIEISTHAGAVGARSTTDQNFQLTGAELCGEHLLSLRSCPGPERRPQRHLMYAILVRRVLRDLRMQLVGILRAVFLALKPITKAIA